MFFIPLLLLPFIGILIFEGNKWYLLFACLYIFLLQIFRLLYIGIKFNQVLLAFTPFGIKYWWKMWERDPVNTTTYR